MSRTVRTTDLETMDRAALMALWSETFGTPVPKGLSQPFLRRFLAFELQSGCHGGLPTRLKAQLAARQSGKLKTAAPLVKPGGRLLREWNGVTHVVDVIEEGYLWEGQRHRSLSAIARAITGARWSGPRFFGLKGKAST